MKLLRSKLNRAVKMDSNQSSVVSDLDEKIKGWIVDELQDDYSTEETSEDVAPFFEGIKEVSNGNVLKSILSIGEEVLLEIHYKIPKGNSLLSVDYSSQLDYLSYESNGWLLESYITEASSFLQWELVKVGKSADILNFVFVLGKQ